MDKPHTYQIDRPRPRARTGVVPVDRQAQRRLPLLLRRAWFGLNQTFRRLSTRKGLTPDQFTVLRTMGEHEPRALTQHELAELMTSDPNTIASLLARMEAGGMIRRQPDARDRRARRLQLTALGRRQFEHARPLALELQQRVLAALPSVRRQRFLRDLEIIANACHQAQQGSENHRS